MSESSGFVNLNAYRSVVPEICKESLLTVFNLAYKGGSQNVKKYVRKNKIRIEPRHIYEDFKANEIENFDVTLIKTLLENPEICDLGNFAQVEEDESGEITNISNVYRLEYNEWGNESRPGIKGEIPSLEFWIREIVNIRNECSHNQKKDMTEEILNDKLNILKRNLQEMIAIMKFRYSGVKIKGNIDRLEQIIKESLQIKIPIWKDVNASLENELMESVYDMIENDKEIDIKLPYLGKEKYSFDVPPSKVYLNIKGKGSNRQISSTDMVKVLRDKQIFPHRCMVLVGLPGVGKTTSMFRIKEEHKTAIKNKKKDQSNPSSKINLEFEKVEDIDVLIYQPLRNKDHRSLTDLFHYKFGPVTERIIPHSRQLQHILLKRKAPTLLLLDAIDESTEASDELVRDIWKIKDDFRNLYIIFTTRGSASNVLRELAGKEYDNMCVNVTGLDPSEFVENAGKLIDTILEDREDRETNPEQRKREALSNLQKIKQKFPPVGINPLLLTIAVRLVLDPFMRVGNHIDNLNSMTQLIKGMIESLIRRLCDSTHIEIDIVENFLEFLETESLSMLQRNDFSVNPDLTEALRRKIKEHGIHEEYVIERVLQSFLSKKEEDIFQHLHAVTQAFLAAKALLKMLTKSSDKKHEINKQMEGIPKEHQQTVLMLLVGILHVKKEVGILDETALEICRYFDFPKYNWFGGSDTLATQLHLLQESFAVGSGEPNAILEREITSKAPNSIYIYDEALEIIKYMMTRDEMKCWPKEITITVQSNPDNILNLESVLKLLIERDSCLYLEVDQCSEKLLRNLPENLERLMLHWKMGDVVKMVEALNTRLPSLRKLKLLLIYLYEEGSLPEEELPRLCYEGSLLCLDIRVKFNDNDVGKLAHIMDWACKERSNLANGFTLNHSPLSYLACEKLLDELSNLNVQAIWLMVQDAKLSKDERNVLQKKAERSGIRLFVPPGEYLFVRGQTLEKALYNLKAQPFFIMDLIKFVIEVLSVKDHCMTPLLAKILKEYSRWSPASLTSDLLQSNSNLQEDFIFPLSKIILQMYSAEPDSLHELLKKGLESIENTDALSSDFGVHMKGIIFMVGKKMMEENPGFVVKMMTQPDTASLLQRLAPLLIAGTPGNSENTSTENKMSDVKDYIEDDLD